MTQWILLWKWAKFTKARPLLQCLFSYVNSWTPIIQDCCFKPKCGICHAVVCCEACLGASRKNCCLPEYTETHAFSWKIWSGKVYCKCCSPNWSLNRSVPGLGFASIDHAAKIIAYHKKTHFVEKLRDSRKNDVITELKKRIANKKFISQKL